MNPGTNRELIGSDPHENVVIPKPTIFRERGRNPGIRVGRALECRGIGMAPIARGFGFVIVLTDGGGFDKKILRLIREPAGQRRF